MERLQALDRLQRTFAAVVRQRLEDEAARQGWPLPDPLSLHLWLYAEGFSGPTLTDLDHFE